MLIDVSSSQKFRPQFFRLINNTAFIFIARKGSLRRLCFTRVCLSIGRGLYPSMPCRSTGPHPEGRLRGLAWGISRPAHGGKLRGLAWGGSPGPHREGEDEGSGLEGFQANTWRDVFRPTPGGGGSRPTPAWCIPACTEAEPPLADSYCCGQYAFYWNAFLLTFEIIYEL